MHHLKYALLLVFCTSLPDVLSAQEFNYWNQQVGARSSMLSGAVTAGVNDNSAIYYNPSALGDIENSNLSVSSDGYYLNWLKIQNGAGRGLDLSANGLNIVPQIFSLIVKVPGIKASSTLAIMNRDYSQINTSLRNETYTDVTQANPGNEYYIGEYSYFKNAREDWVGAGVGQSYDNGWSFGGSAMVSFRSEYYSLYQNAQVFSYNNDTTSYTLIGQTQFLEDLDIRNFGLMLLGGVTWKSERVKVAMNITLPRINLGFLTKGDLRRTFLSSLPSADTTIAFSLWQQKAEAQIKSPFIMDLGVELRVSPKTLLMAKMSYFHRVRRYNILKLDELQTGTVIPMTPETRLFQNMVMANRAVVNFALGMETTISDNVKLLAGARTDGNYFDTKAIDLENDYYSGLSYWDLVHLTGGIIWHFGQVDLDLGLSYTFARNGNQRQLVNLSDPTEENLLFGERDYTARHKFNQISVFFGFTYYIRDSRTVRE